MDPEQKLAALEESLRNIIEATKNLLATGRKLSVEEETKLANVINLTGQKILELRQRIADEEQASVSINGPPTEKLSPAPYPSSNINSFKYDPKNEQLYVKFHGKDTADSGPTYSYQGVPEYIFDVFRRGAVGPKTSGSNKYHTWYRGVTPSLGAAMYALIKEGPYNYQKVA